MEALVNLTKHGTQTSVTLPPTHRHKHTHLFHHASFTFSSGITTVTAGMVHMHFFPSLIKWHWIDHLKLSFICALANEFSEVTDIWFETTKLHRQCETQAHFPAYSAISRAQILFVQIDTWLMTHFCVINQSFSGLQCLFTQYKGTRLNI